MIILHRKITPALSLFDFAQIGTGRGPRTLQIHPDLPSSNVFSREASFKKFTKSKYSHKLGTSFLFSSFFNIGAPDYSRRMVRFSKNNSIFLLTFPQIAAVQVETLEHLRKIRSTVPSQGGKQKKQFFKLPIDSVAIRPTWP